VAARAAYVPDATTPVCTTTPRDDVQALSEPDSKPSSKTVWVAATAVVANNATPASNVNANSNDGHDRTAGDRSASRAGDIQRT
jgi:hypothetical protein